MNGFDSKNRHTLDNKFICSLCSFILRQPCQLTQCGHRFCQLCLQHQRQTSIKCPQCQTDTSSDQIILDRGFQREMQSLPITCAYCDWSHTLQHYQSHLDQDHSRSQCAYCNESFTSVHLLSQHQTSQCPKVTVQCVLRDFGCTREIVRCELLDHYLSHQHQQSIRDVIEQMRTQLTDVSMESDHAEASATNDNTLVPDQLKELDETMQILASGMRGVHGETEQQLGDDLPGYEKRLRELVEKASNRSIEVEEEYGLLGGISQNLDILNQELMKLEESIEDRWHASYDGTLVWRITGVAEKMRDAESERQTSIYSPPFYSSSTGYKMRVRLYLNGDGNARRTHMSLFFVLMRGPNDPILKFPFNYKVTFCLYDQTTQRRHIIDSFRPDIKSNSFQRPRSEMNIASGIPKFFPLAMIQQEGNPYVRNDTMFIRVLVDFGDMPKALLPYALSLDPGIPTSIQQELIKREEARRSNQQNS